MPMKARLLLLLALVLVPVWPALAQEAFDVDAVAVRGASPVRPRLDVYARVPYALLNFTNVPGGFQARYTVSLDVYAVDARARQRQFIVSRSWDRTIPVASAALTRSGASDRTTNALDLSPGRYLLQFQLEDGSTRRTYTREVTVQVRDLSAPVALSDVALVERYDAGTNTMTPRVSNALGTDDEQVQVFYELYAEAATRVRVIREVMRTGGRDAAYTSNAVQALRPGRNPFVATLALRDLTSGAYVVRVRVQTEGGQPIASAEKNVEVTWQGLANHIRNLDDAIAQLRHVAKDRDLDYIRAGNGDADKLNRFRAFWARLDPTPGTERNERMEEYYYRVDYANRRFGVGRLRSGWDTDRGEVLIRFGEPDNVRRHPFSMGARPYEVWEYPRLNRRFVFIDQTGFGDYQLRIPIWDERNRM
jgi:GWxTD domain-containing protein